MPRAVSARRYAQAVFQIALEKDQLDLWLEDLALLARALENRQLSEFLDSPQVPVGQKVKLIKNTLDNAVDPLAVNLISLLASRSITYVLPGIIEHYQRLLDAHRGVAQAEVVSAVPLGDDQRRRLEALLKEMIGKEIRLVSRVESQILGGLVARVGDRVIDGSTVTKLQGMRRSLIEQRS